VVVAIDAILGAVLCGVEVAECSGSGEVGVADDLLALQQLGVIADPAGFTKRSLPEK
jgi:hypothetical protein